MNNPKQLIFPWITKNKASFEHYYFEDINLSLKDALLKQDDLFVYGISGTGKSFLLQSTSVSYTHLTLPTTPYV